MSKLPYIIISPTLAHFLIPNKATILFALKGSIAVGMALSIAIYLTLDNPFWAAIPAVMLQARPHTGFVMEKALFLVASSLVGAVLAFLILNYFIHIPILAVTLLALIVAVVTFFSSTVRHANFVFGLALIAVTANMIVLFAISHIENISSQTIFNIAFARVSEVMVGASCAIFASALLFPLRMKDVLSTHTRLLISHLHNYLVLVLDAERSEEEEEKQLKILLGIIILINDDSSPNFYEHRQNAKRALYMANQSLSLMALAKSLDRKNLKDLKTLLEQFKTSFIDHQLKSYKLNFELLKKQFQLVSNVSQTRTFQSIFEIYENILTAEYENHQHKEFTPQHYSKRLKTHRDLLSGLMSSIRIVLVYLICISIWAISDGSSSLLMMVILPVLFGQMFVQAPNPSLILIKLGKGALISIPIVVIVLFSLMSGITGYLEIFLLIFLPFLFIGLMAIANPTITPYGLGFCFSLITLVQPGNHMNFASDQSLIMGLGMASSMLITALAFQLIPKISPVLLQKRIINNIAKQIQRIGKSKVYGHEKFNQELGEKLFYSSSLQNTTSISHSFFQYSILGLSIGHFLINLQTEIRFQKCKFDYSKITEHFYEIYSISRFINQPQYALEIDKKINEINEFVDNLDINIWFKQDLKELIREYRNIIVI